MDVFAVADHHTSGRRRRKKHGQILWIGDFAVGGIPRDYGHRLAEALHQAGIIGSLNSLGCGMFVGAA